MAATDYFLKIDGIDGESQKDKHTNEIELLSFSWGEANSGTFAYGGGGGAGKVNMQDFSFMKVMDKASPGLFLACANGEHIKTAKLTARKAGKNQQDFLKITFSDLLISSYQTSGSGGGDVVPTESVAINFAKIEFEYAEQKADGTLKPSTPLGFNLKEGKQT
jgi:type VI secretion system secreted protein Hcp